MTPSKTPAEILDIDGEEVRISSPDKMVFPEPGLTKLDLVRYYVAVAEGALRGAGGTSYAQATVRTLPFDSPTELTAHAS